MPIIYSNNYFVYLYNGKLIMKPYIVCILLFLITSCASNTKLADGGKNYNSVWIKKVKGKSVMAPNGYLYVFKDNGNVEYRINGMKRGSGTLLYAETPTNAYYYEKMPLKYVAREVRDSIPDDSVKMVVGFILDNNNRLKMTLGYTREYNQRLADWRKNNLTIYNTLREGKDMSEYPIPNPEEVDNRNIVEFGVLR